MARELLLEVKNLHVIYKADDETVYAVNGVNLSLNKGETLGLVGETGAGKTTAALSVLRLLPERVSQITEGAIFFEGADLTQLPESKMCQLRGQHISMIFQDPMTSLNPIRTVGDQIEEALLLHKKSLSKEETADRVDEILELVGISKTRKGDYPHQFSGGMKQRIVIAIALVCEPKLLLADEPTTALDVTIQAQVLELMRGLKEKLATAMILITHDLGVVAQSCDHVAVMYAGEIIEVGRAYDIFKGQNHHPYTIGLFGSLPDMAKNSSRLSPIAGLMPDPTNLPKGCKFHTRCPRRMDICTSEMPPKAVDGSHIIQCHLYGTK